MKKEKHKHGSISKILTIRIQLNPISWKKWNGGWIRLTHVDNILANIHIIRIHLIDEADDDSAIAQEVDGVEGGDLNEKNGIK